MRAEMNYIIAKSPTQQKSRAVVTEINQRCQSPALMIAGASVICAILSLHTLLRQDALENLFQSILK